MDTININRVAISHSKYGIETIPEWSNLDAFNHHVTAVSKQKDAQMYFPIEAVIKFHNSNGTLKDIKLIRINKPVKIII